MGYLKASKYFQIPKRNLEQYVKDKNCTPEELVGVCLGRKPVLSRCALEESLCYPTSWKIN
jgi:hypothetical protein